MKTLPTSAVPLMRLRSFALHSILTLANLWSEDGTDLGAEGLFVDAGDIAPFPDQDMFAGIESAITRLLDHGLRPLCLGGDHAVTFPIVKAMSAHHPRLSILHFDAHPDLYDHFQGNRRSHASPFARIMEAGLVERLVQIGIRTMVGHQREQVKKVRRRSDRDEGLA